MPGLFVWRARCYIQKMKTLTISVTEQQASLLEEAVAEGRFASDSDLIAAALALWQRCEAARAQEAERLREAFEAGLASGPPTPLDRDAFFAEARARRAARG